MKKIKILITCHKPAVLIKNDILTPIQVGCDLTEVRFPGMLRDNEGENISKKNPLYCELTAQYWAWKNLDADYYGFLHYRRYLNFSDKTFPVDCWGNVVQDYPLKGSVKQFGLCEEKLREVVEENDMLIAAMKDVSHMPTQEHSVYEQYKNGSSLHIQDMDMIRNIIHSRYPAYAEDMEAYLKGKKTCLCNLYIMKRELFFEYAEWLFDILHEFERNANMSDYSVEGMRTPAHLAERLLTLYYLHLKRTRKLKIKEMQTIFFSHTEPMEKLKPAFNTNNVAIVLAANDYYVPYTSTLLESLYCHISERWNYDIIILHQNISSKNQDILRAQLAEKKNIMLRFSNLEAYSKVLKKLHLDGHVTLETYFRLLMPTILKNYDKALYLDSDLILNADPAELYETDITGYLLAACHDVDTIGLYNGYKPNKKYYMDHILKIKNPYMYFQAGVLLFNLKEFREQFSMRDILKFASLYKWELHDQDVLNYLAQGKVKYVDLVWNVMTDWAGIRIKQIISLAPKQMQESYFEARRNPNISHYAGPDKPWHQPDADRAEDFWQYARRCPYYEVILQRMCMPRYEKFEELMIRWIMARSMSMLTIFFPYKTQRRKYLKWFLKKIGKGIFYNPEMRVTKAGGER